MHRPALLQFTLQPLQRSLVLHRRPPTPRTPRPQPRTPKLRTRTQFGTIGAQPGGVGAQPGAVRTGGAITQAWASSEPRAEAGARVWPGAGGELGTGRAAGTRRRRCLLQQHRFTSSHHAGLGGSGTKRYVW